MFTFKKISATAIVFLAITSQAVWAGSPLQGAWSGIISNGQSKQQVVMNFNEQGYLLYSYINKEDKAIQIPLDYQNQLVEYLPSGGGVASINIRYLEKSDAGLVMTLEESFQKASNNYLQQSFTTTLFKAVLTEKGLNIAQKTSEEGGMSDVGSSSETNLSLVNNRAETYRGLLQKNQ